MTTTSTSSGVARYVAVVCIGGAVMLGLVLTTGFDRAGSHPAQTVLFALMAFLAQLAPINMERGRSEKEVNVCGTFTFALLLSVGPAPAALVAAASASAADLLHRKAPARAAFNGLQTALSMGAAAMVLQLYDANWMERTFTVTADVIPLFLAGGVMLVVNHLLVAGVVAISQGMPVTAQIRGDFGFQAATTGVMITMAPVLGAAAAEDLVLVPLLLVPLAAVYAAARGVSKKENTAFYDGLTGLPNRAWFQQWAIPGWAARPDGTLVPGARVAVMLIDLDRFKEVNDTLGHRVGDELLKLIGPRLAPALGPDDKVARMGGDEFAVLLNDVPDEEEALRRARLLLEGLEQPFELSGLSLAVEASMGIALGPDHGVDIDSLLQRADVAMYEAKEGRGGCELYRADRDPYSPEKLALLGELRAALETDQCVLHYQPKARLDTGEIVGVEVLIRWAHPDRGLLPPDLFVPLAERTGLSRTLTLYVLESALRQCRRWHELGLEMKVAV
ncbi:MAG TPA: diguanylate cyclase, partial [Acidimicrobiales bacterium]|nr:diguanylate cyclase [Acidimicrobiales bacterium]